MEETITAAQALHVLNPARIQPLTVMEEAILKTIKANCSDAELDEILKNAELEVRSGHPDWLIFQKPPRRCAL